MAALLLAPRPRPRAANGLVAVAALLLALCICAAAQPVTLLHGAQQQRQQQRPELQQHKLQQQHLQQPQANEPPPPAAQLPFVWDARTCTALALAFLVAALAAAAGVGGGAFFVPLFLVLLGYGLKDATVLSQATITAVSAASIAFNLAKRHPAFPDRPLIEYNLLLTMTPALLAGVAGGVILNAAFPTWLITLMLLSLLAFMSVRTAQKGLQQWRSETAAQRAAAAAAEAAAAEAAPLVSSGSDADQGAPSSAGAVVVIEDAVGRPAASDAPAADAKPSAAGGWLPWPKVAGVVGLWLGFAALQLLRQWTQRCSPAFWALLAGQFLFGAVCSSAAAWLCIARPARLAEEAAAGGASAPLLASSSAASLNSLLAQRARHQQASMAVLLLEAAKVALAGLTAGIVGIGGGMLMGPMLLEAGCHPASAAATSNVLVAMTASSATLAFALQGRVPVHAALAFCAVCGAASLLGLTGVGRLVRRFGRPSLIVLLLAGIMGTGGLLSAVFGALDVLHDAGSGWKSIC